MLKEAAFAVGLNITRQTSDDDVYELIKLLRPLDCGKKLIRIGRNGAGGYLLPDDLEGIEYCFSPGVSTVADFESELASRQINSFLADYSVDGPPVRNPRFIFDKKFLGANDSEIFMTLASWKDKYLQNYSADMLLQMDIEGFEYEVILSTPLEVLNGFRIIIVEFHYLEKIFDPIVFTFYRASFQKLLKNFHVVHVHPNNHGDIVKRNHIEVPTVVEMTFYNKRRTTRVRPASTFPHPLDLDNAPHLRTLPLPKCWYAAS